MRGRRSVFRWTTALALSAALVLGVTTTVSGQTGDQQGHKSPPLALALSVLVPGAGQFYNGDYLKGGVMLGGAVITAGAILLTASDVLGKKGIPVRSVIVGVIDHLDVDASFMIKNESS